MVSTECITLSHHHKDEKWLSQIIVSWGLSIHFFFLILSLCTSISPTENAILSPSHLCTAKFCWPLDNQVDAHLLHEVLPGAPPQSLLAVSQDIYWCYLWLSGLSCSYLCISISSPKRLRDCWGKALCWVNLMRTVSPVTTTGPAPG